MSDNEDEDDLDDLDSETGSGSSVFVLEGGSASAGAGAGASGYHASRSHSHSHNNHDHPKHNANSTRTRSAPKATPTPVGAAYRLIGAWAKGTLASSIGRVKTLATRTSAADINIQPLPRSPHRIDSPVDLPLELLEDELARCIDRDGNLIGQLGFHKQNLNSQTFRSSECNPCTQTFHRNCSSFLLPASNSTLSSSKNCTTMPQPLLQHILHHNLSELPTEIILRIFEFLPSSSLTALLLTSVHTSLVATAVLSSRSHHINDLEDLRSFTHDIPFLLIPWFMTSSHFSESKTSKYSTYSVNSAKKSTSFSPYFSHQLKRKQLGPIFYRAGTMILFAKHFTRLIPEARLLLGFGYAMVLAWFMCLFYLVPFWGALSLYFAMDLVDLFSRSMAIFIHSLPLSMLCFFLPKSHPLHPQQPPEAPRVPAQLIRRLKFSASAHITPGQNEPLRCCGLAGTGWDLDRYEIDPNVDTTITGKAATANLTQPSTIHSNTKPTPFWGLMSSYTPWHLYLLTHTLSLHPAIQNLTLSRISLAWWFRLHPVPHLQILILHACELDETGIGLVAQAFPGLLGLVLRGSEVRCGGWDVESIRRGSADRTSSSTIPSLHSQTNTPPEYLGTPTGWWSKHRTVKNGPDPSVTHFTSLRIVRFEMCPASCAVDAVRMVLDRCPTVERIEFVGCGLEEETFLEGNVSGVVVEFERIAFDRAGSYKAGSLWWEGQSRFAEKIETVIKRTGCQIVNKTQSSDNEIDEEQEFAPASTPPGFRKCIVIQGQALFGLRDKWYIHVRASRVWGQ